MYKKTSIIMASAIAAILSVALVSANQAFAVTTVTGGNGFGGTGGPGGTGGTGGTGGPGGYNYNYGTIAGQTGGTNIGRSNSAAQVANGGNANGVGGGATGCIALSSC